MDKDAAERVVHARLGTLADATRTRLLLLLGRHELSVNELSAATQLPQSTVSRHLKALGDSGWVASRAEGTSNVYTMTRASNARARTSRCRRRREGRGGSI